MRNSYPTGLHSEKGPRPTNQDASRVDPDRGWAVLADGVGGATGGAAAAVIAVEVLARGLGRLEEGPPVDVSGLLRELTAEANRAVWRRAHEEPELAGMGTTLVTLVLRGERYYVAHVGDSRAYRLRDGHLTPLTRDDSLVQARLDAGLITPEEAASQKDHNVITRAIGSDDSVEPHVAEGQIREGDVFVLTSDGVHAVLSEREIAETLEELEPQEAATRLVRSSLERGSRDNATAAVVRVGTRRVTPGLDAILNGPVLGTHPDPGPGSRLSLWIAALLAAALAILAWWWQRGADLWPTATG